MVRMLAGVVVVVVVVEWGRLSSFNWKEGSCRHMAQYRVLAGHAGSIPSITRRKSCKNGLVRVRLNTGNPSWLSEPREY